MADVLSQSEIDALLGALTRGEVNADDMRETETGSRIRSYDFRRAMRFSKDHIRIISRIHEHFARLLTTQLSAQLRSFIQIQVESVDQVPYEEFILSIPSLTVLQVMEFAPLEGHVVIEINPQLVFAIVDRLMGGSASGPYRERELTEIEQTVVERGMRSVPSFFREAWKNVTPLEPRIVSFETNPQFLQIATPNETVLVVTLSARIGDATGLMNICIPHVTIEPVIPKLTTQYLFDVTQSKHVHHNELKRLEQHLNNVDVDCSVVLGNTELSVEQVLELQVGDVIKLSGSIHDEVSVHVNGVPALTGAVGTHRDHYAVKVLEVLEGVNFDDGQRETLASGN